MSARVVGRMGSLALVAFLMAAVHGAVLKSTMESVEAGQVLPLVGEDFHAGMTVTLSLVGVFDDHAVGEATASDEGGFTKDLMMPSNARPGDYQVVAYEPNGDRAAALDVMVLAASAVAVTADAHDDGASHEGAEMTAATAEEMVIARSMGGAGWGVIGLMVGLAGGLGLALLSGAPATEV